MPPQKIDNLEAALEEYRVTAIGNFTAPTYTFRQMLKAANAPRFALRNWLTQRSLPLAADEDRDGGQHRLFSRKDVLTVALASRFHELKVPVSEFPAAGGPIIAMIEKDIGAVQMSAGSRRRIVRVARAPNGDWTVEPFDPSRVGEADSAVCLLVNVDKLVDDTLIGLGLKKSDPKSA